MSISILGINEAGYDSGNTLAGSGRDIPWLQDSQEQNVWLTWGIAFRDVLIVDAEGTHYATFNLTANSLSSGENVEALRALLLEAAGYSE